jgi:hypothetical protein
MVAFFLFYSVVFTSQSSILILLQTRTTQYLEFLEQ